MDGDGDNRPFTFPNLHTCTHTHSHLRIFAPNGHLFTTRFDLLIFFSSTFPLVRSCILLRFVRSSTSRRPRGALESTAHPAGVPRTGVTMPRRTGRGGGPYPKGLIESSPRDHTRARQSTREMGDKPRPVDSFSGASRSPCLHSFSLSFFLWTRSRVCVFRVTHGPASGTAASVSTKSSDESCQSSIYYYSSTHASMRACVRASVPQCLSASVPQCRSR